MSDLDDKQPEMAEMLNKFSRYNKNVKALMELMNKAIEKLDVLVKNKSSEHNDADADASVTSRGFATKRGLIKSLRKRLWEDRQELMKQSRNSIWLC